MIVVVQRVKQASVTVDGEIIGQIGVGMLALAAVHASDSPGDVDWMARKLLSLRMFASGERAYELDITEIAGEILLVSNFTVAAETQKGRRPSLSLAADPQKGRRLFDELLAAVSASSVRVATGKFQADMAVSLINDGPVTFLLNSQRKITEQQNV